MGTRAGRKAIGLLVVVAAVIAGSSVSAVGDAVHSPGAPTLLTVDDAAAPVAVEGAPEFGWVVNAADRGAVQTAYQLVVRAIPIGGGRGKVIWDSGKVQSSQQSYVVPTGMTLQSDRSYTWTVRTWDRTAGPGPFSNAARFDVGIGDGDWHAQWIRRPMADRAPLEDFSLLRKTFAVSASPIVRARAYLSAGQQYDLSVNGVRVAQGPPFSYPDEQYYQSADITTLLRAGSGNAIGVVTHWSTPGKGRPESVPALIARITVDHADGTRQVITSDTTWRTHTGAWIQGPLRNDPGESGDYIEHIDGRLDPIGWQLPGFSDRNWTPAASLGPHPVAPFVHLYAARTHIVEHRMMPLRFSRLGNGAYVADFGTVIAAIPEITFAHGAAGRPVSILGGFLLDPNGQVSKTRGIQQTDMHWYYDERSGRQVFRPFGYLGYRYLEVDGAGERLAAGDVVSLTRHASMPDESAASFTSSNPAIDAVWNLARHSALYSAQEQFISTPTREKGSFMDPFDSSVTMAAFDDRAMTFEALRDFARSQQRFWPTGPVNVVYPTGEGKRDIPDSTEQFVQWVWHVYQTTGDVHQLASLYPVVRNIADYINRAIDPSTGLVTNLPGGGSDYLYGLVDWPPQSRFGYDMATAARTTENILAVDDFRAVADLAQALGRPSDEVSTQLARAQLVTSSILTRLRRPDGVLVDGLESNGTPSTHASQLANAYALALRITPPSDIGTVGNYVESLGNETGVSTFTNLLVALHNSGHDQALVAAITDPNRPGYAQILKEGATFTWESWDARRTGDSESHGFGSGVLSVLQDELLGVHVSSPGSAKIDVHIPALVPMHVTGVYVTQRGRIPISWSYPAPGRFSLDVTIPANVEATVHLPVPRVGSVRDGTSSVVHDPGITASSSGPGEVVLTVGSGHYRFHTI